MHSVSPFKCIRCFFFASPFSHSFLSLFISQVVSSLLGYIYIHVYIYIYIMMNLMHVVANNKPTMTVIYAFMLVKMMMMISSSFIDSYLDRFIGERERERFIYIFFSNRTKFFISISSKKNIAKF